MNPSDSVVQQVAKVQNLAGKLADVGENVSDFAVMAKILASLPPKFNALKTAWDSVDAEKQTIENLQERLIKEETRITADDETATAFAAMSMKPKKGEKYPKKKKSLVTCYAYQGKNHYAW